MRCAVCGAVTLSVTRLEYRHDSLPACNACVSDWLHAPERERGMAVWHEGGKLREARADAALADFVRRRWGERRHTAAVERTATPPPRTE